MARDLDNDDVEYRGDERDRELGGSYEPFLTVLRAKRPSSSSLHGTHS